MLRHVKRQTWATIAILVLTAFLVWLTWQLTRDNDNTAPVTTTTTIEVVETTILDEDAAEENDDSAS